MNTCNKCQGKFTWAKPYTGDKVPAGDNPCTCDAHPVASKPTATPRVEVPIEQIVAEIIAIKDTMATKKEGDNNTYVDLTPQMIEGIWKFAISRKMSR